MKLRRLLACLVALMIAVPAASAFAADQEVNVRVLPSDTLSISVDGWADFGGAEVGETRHFDFWLNVTNTMNDGWQVTVTGGDLTSFTWEGCDQNGCYNPIPTEPDVFTIPKSNLIISGGDLDWWDVDDPSSNTIRSYSGSPGDSESPLTLLQGTSYAHGEFGLDNPMSSLDLTIPAGTQQNQQYRTVLVYTIMPWTAP
jgi:hypothetical protein